MHLRYELYAVRTRGSYDFIYEDDNLIKLNVIMFLLGDEEHHLVVIDNQGELPVKYFVHGDEVPIKRKKLYRLVKYCKFEKILKEQEKIYKDDIIEVYNDIYDDITAQAIAETDRYFGKRTSQDKNL